MLLNALVKQKDRRFEELVDYLTNSVLTKAQMQKVYCHFNVEWKLNN